MNLAMSFTVEYMPPAGTIGMGGAGSVKSFTCPLPWPQRRWSLYHQLPDRTSQSVICAHDFRAQRMEARMVFRADRHRQSTGLICRRADARLPVERFGPRVQAIVGYLTGRLGLSHRDVTETLETIYGEEKDEYWI